MARSIAAVDYFVIRPDPCCRSERDFWLKKRTDVAMAHMFILIDSLNAATTECDTQAMLQFVQTQPNADARRVGAVGYCMSGPIVMWAAAISPNHLRCIASIHGASISTVAPDSPHRMAPLIHCDTYFACAEIDKWAPPADIALLQEVPQIASRHATPHRMVFGCRAWLCIFAARGCRQQSRRATALFAAV